MINKKLIALVPVRKGSQRVKNKNIKSFGDISLLQLKINILKQVKNLDEIIINSDCADMLNIAKKNGVSTYKRDEYYGRSIINNSDFFEHIAQNTEENSIIMYSPVTCPFIKVSTYEDAISKFRDFENYNSLTSAFEVNHHMWREGKPINYDPYKTPNSQDLPEILGMSYGISIVERELMIKRKNVVGDKPYFYKLSEIESVDIDTPVEFDFAEFIYNNKLKNTDFLNK